MQAEMHTNNVPKKRHEVSFPPRISIEQGDEEEQKLDLMIAKNERESRQLIKKRNAILRANEKLLGGIGEGETQEGETEEPEETEDQEAGIDEVPEDTWRPDEEDIL